MKLAMDFILPKNFALTYFIKLNLCYSYDMLLFFKGFYGKGKISEIVRTFFKICLPVVVCWFACGPGLWFVAGLSSLAAF